MYKAGYDPSAMLNFFEKLQAKEKAKPGTMSTLFTDHPPTAARIAAIKKEIETILPSREQYTVSTSEFDTVKARLMSLEKGAPSENAGRPTYRRTSGRGRPPNSSPAPTDSQTDPTVQTPPADPQQGEDDRPKLKRTN